MPTPLPDLLAALARGTVDAQHALDENGRDSLDRFELTGIPPTVFTWSTVGVDIPIALALTPKRAAGDPADGRVTGTGDGCLTCRLRYVESPQGVDNPRPYVRPEEQKP
jgi:hypothetical protein